MQTVSDLKNFTDWLSTNNQAGKGIITEFGITGSSQAATDPILGSGTGAKFDVRWENVMQQWFEMCNRNNLSVTAWNASEWRVDLRAYETDDGNNKILNYRTNVSSVLENNLGTANYKRGVNYAGGEFSDRGPNGSLDRSTTVQPGAGYYYPTPGSFALLASRGMTLIRIPIRWERVQPTLKQPLDTTEMAKLMVSVNAANAAGCQVLIDVHNYARYDTTPTGANANGVYVLGQNAPATQNGQNVGGTMISCFADLWSRLATYFNANGAVWGYDLCNEPHDCPGGVSDWQEASRQAVEAIRLIQPTVKIAVEGYSYATVPNWTSTNGATPWLTEIIPAGQTGAGSARNTDANILWNGHHYPDPASNGNDGGFQDTYDRELQYAQSQGFTSWSTSGYTAPPTNTTQQTGLRTVFKSSFDDSSDFTGTYDSVNKGSNTVTFGGTLGNPGGSLNVGCSTTSDDGSVHKSLTGSVFRIWQFDFSVDPSAAITGSGAFGHAWKDDNSTDFFEFAVNGSGNGYTVGLRLTTDYAYRNTLATILTKNTAPNHTVKIVVSDTAVNLYLDGSTTAEATVSGSFASTNIGGFALGKYYAQNISGTVRYDNLACGSNTTYYAPPNGGQMSYTAPVNPTNQKGLLSFLFG